MIAGTKLIVQNKISRETEFRHHTGARFKRTPAKTRFFNPLIPIGL